MPLYLYETVEETGRVGRQFTVQQAMSDAPLKVHPETGQAVYRVLQPPSIGGRSAFGQADSNLASDSKLERLGFTKYVKAGDGMYEKTAGTGPNVIGSDGTGLPG